jgi:hypothetical protein
MELKTFDGAQKKRIREMLFDGFSYNNGACIFLPGKDAFCVREAEFFLPPETHVIAVERDISIFYDMRKNIRQTHFKNVDYIRENIHNLVLEETVSFLNLDLLGSITFDICDWLRNVLASKLHTGSRICLTVSNEYRAIMFPKKFREYYSKQNKKITQYFLDRGFDFNDEMSTPIQMLAACFPNCKLSFFCAEKYSDTCPMYFYIIDIKETAIDDNRIDWNFIRHRFVNEIENDFRFIVDGDKIEVFKLIEKGNKEDIIIKYSDHFSKNKLLL